MKILTLILAFACLALTARSQDWAPVPAGCRMVYGLTDTVITQVVWIESQAGDTVRLNRRIWACDTCTSSRGDGYSETEEGIVHDAPAYYIDQPHTLGSSWFIEDGMIRLLDFQEVGRELRMPLVAEVGQSWFWNGGSATLESVEVRDFWGEDDSVRVLLLNNSQRVEWSRNHGLVRFPQPRRDNPLRLIGIERENVRQGITVPSFEMIFDYRVGDRFEMDELYIDDPVYYKSRRQYTVRQVRTIADSISVRLNVRWRSDKYCYPKDPITGQWDRSKPLEFISYEVGQEEDITWIFHQSYHHGLGVYPSQIAVLPLMDYRDENGRPVMIQEQAWFGKQRILHDSNWNRTVVEMEESGWFETAIRDPSNPKRFFPNGGINEGFWHSSYAVGIGNILYDEILQMPPMSRRRLVAWSRGEESYGQFSSESYITSRAASALAQQVALYPNPTRDVLHIANLPDGARLTLTDPLGRVVRRQAADTTIDVSDLPAGLWFLRVEGGNAPQTLRFIKE